MTKLDIKIFDPSSYQRKRHILYDILEYIFIIVISLSAVFVSLLSFSDHIKAYF